MRSLTALPLQGLKGIVDVATGQAAQSQTPYIIKYFNTTIGKENATVNRTDRHHDMAAHHKLYMKNTIYAGIALQ